MITLVKPFPDMKRLLLVFSILILGFGCQKSVHKQKEPHIQTPFMLGIDYFIKNYSQMLKGQRVGLLTNPSGVNAQLEATSDVLFKHPDVNLTALYGPEHGIRGVISGGLHIADTVDAKTGVPVYSLYGERRKPTAETLKNVDVILVDIQDIGLRGYTYIYTMAKVMEAAAENQKEVIVLDRPNPIGGNHVEGNLVRDGFYSFVGLYPIPYQHGMTIGELALLFNQEYGIGCQLTVIPMLGWKRNMMWGKTNLAWVPTSPHVPHWRTILYMGATGTFGELRTLSEGVGYTSPFETIGAPWINEQEFSEALNALDLPGIHFRPLFFKPYYFTYESKILKGVQLHITDQESFRPYLTGLYIMQTHIKLYPGQNLFKNSDRLSMFDQIMGTDQIRMMLEQNMPIEEMEASWQAELEMFKKIREKYLLY